MKMIKTETLEMIENYPVQDEAYAIMKGENGKFAFAWGWEYPGADELPEEPVTDGSNGFEWYDTEEEARAAMKHAVAAWE